MKATNLETTYQSLLVILAFLLPITVVGSNLIIGIIVILWFLSGQYSKKFKEILSSKILIASILFFSFHVIGLIWTKDFEWGIHIIKKMWYFLLLFPILFSLTRKQNIKFYISAFLLAISITEVLSYLVWFEIIPPFKNASIHNPTPFMSHISYNPILAFAIYIVSYKIFIERSNPPIKFFLYVFFAISMSINMFITGGRAGQVMFFGVIAIIIFQYFKHQKFKAVIVSILISTLIFVTAYQSSSIFNERVKKAVDDIQTYSINKNTSIGLRATFAINSWEVIKKNPILGVGTGDFPDEYKKINTKNSPTLPDATNPHNMYILVLTQLGIIGLVSFLSIFYYQIKFSLASADGFIKDVSLALPLLFLLIMWSDSYLLGHYTTLLYVFFSSFIYKNFEQN